MEIAVLGAGAYLMGNLLQGTPIETLQKDTATELELMLETNREFMMHEARERGLIAPQYWNVSSRVPWHRHAAPYYLDVIGTDNMSDITENLYKRVINPRIHETSDIMEAVTRSRQAFNRKAGNAIYTGFTPEMQIIVDGELESTAIGPYRFLPKNPTDSDYNYAAAMAKVVPRDPMLFTPDSYFPNASGMDFRYSNY